MIFLSKIINWGYHSDSQCPKYSLQQGSKSHSASAAQDESGSSSPMGSSGAYRSTDYSRDTQTHFGTQTVTEEQKVS